MMIGIVSDTCSSRFGLALADAPHLYQHINEAQAKLCGNLGWQLKTYPPS